MPRTSLGLLLPLTFLLAACGSTSSGSSTSTTSSGSGGSAGTGGSGGSGGAPVLDVTTAAGPVKGIHLGTTRAFLGIPYAAPPVGDLRWKPPQPASAWTAPLDASKKGPACAQLAQLGSAFDKKSSEDCLTLNIWTPTKAAAAPGAPVLFWIHGGGFTSGSGGEDTYDGQILSEATGAVVVTINYRLGPLGFLAHSALAAEDAAHPSAGMYGFEDQRFAMAWAKANIAAFGGDPGNVTIFGESAGGIATCLHLVSPPSKGLFHRAITESGPCHIVGQTEKSAETQGDLLATTLGCTDPANALTCLRAKTPEELVTALPLKKGELEPPGVSWLPMVDGINIPDQPGKLLDSGAVAKVPTILGTNKDEGTLFFAIGATAADDTEYQAFMEALFPGHGPEILAKYPSAAAGSAQAAATAALADGEFVCPTRRTARAMAKAGAPTFLYQFVRVASTGIFKSYGVFHSAELPFVFGNPYLGIVLDDDEKKLSATMQAYWFGLASAGDPNAKGGTAWPAYDAAGDENIVLDVTLSSASGLQSTLCDFWDGLVP